MASTTKLKIGDRVRVSETYDDGRHTELRGRIGVIGGISSEGSIGVRFSRWHHGHDLLCGGDLRNGWFFPPSELEPLDVKYRGKSYRMVRKGKKAK